MSQPKLIAGISALLTCLVIVAGCQRYPTPEGGVPAAGSTQDSYTTTGSGTSSSSDPTTPPTDAATETSTGGPTSDGTGGNSNDGDGNSNGNGGGQKATGSPIDVPAIPDPHTSMDGLRAAIEGAFVDACGGQELCVRLQYGTGACLLGYDPTGKVLRGSTVKVLTETQQACDVANGVTPSPIDVPSIPDPHTSMEGLKSAIEGAFVDACGGGELCVQLEYGDGACLLGYDPSDTAERGSTVRVLTESQQDCDAANGVTPPSSDGSNGASPSTGSGDGSGSG